MANEWWMNNRNNMRGYGNTGVTTAFNPNSMAAMVGRTNWTPEKILEETETETIYPDDNDIDATYRAEDAFYRPQPSKFSWPGIIGLAKKVIEPNTREENFGLATFSRNPTTGRVVGSPVYDVFAGGNVASAFGKGLGNRAQKRIDTIENTLRTKYNLSDEEIEDVYAGSYRGDINTQLISRLQNFNNQLANYNKALGNWQGSGIDTRTGGDNRGYVGAQFGDRNYADPGVDAEENQPISNQGYRSAQFDGATTRAEYDRNPTDYSGSFNKGGRVGLKMGGDPTQWMEAQETISPFQIQQEEGVPMGLMASAVDPQDALNDMSMEIFGKPLHLLTGEEYQMLIDMANDQAFGPEPRPVGDPYGTPQGEEIVEEGIARLV